MLATVDEGLEAGLGFPYEHPMPPSSKLWNCAIIAAFLLIAQISLDQGMHIVLYFRGG
jgi:hypothetical protein